MRRTTVVVLTGYLLSALCLGQQPKTDIAYRPAYHFSPAKNWTNDPNGLVYFEGEYHLFFQYNPFGDKWGHMSWGHAVSTDLIHWQQLPVALREENGIMIFTGSTVVDERNTSGFCKDGKPCLVAVYTGHTPEANGKPALQTQNIAYSNDRGRTWTKYTGNPVLDLHMSDFRDPKAFWSDAAHAWVMVVALPNDHKALIYHSPDLKSWTKVSEFGPAGAIGGQWECPELFPIPVDGQPGQSRWILKIGLNPGALQGGSGEQYFVGSFDGNTFKTDAAHPETLWTDYGKDCYCALTFNNLPSSRATAIGWMDNWQYAADLPTAPPFRGQMTVPRQLSLRQTQAGYRLVQQPLESLKKFRSPSRGAHPQSQVFDSEVTLKLGAGDESGIDLNGLRVGYNRSTRKLFIDRTHAGRVDFNEKFPGRVEAALDIPGDSLQLRLLADRDSLEVFADGGLVTMTSLRFPEKGVSLKAFSDRNQASAVSIDSWDLNIR